MSCKSIGRIVIWAVLAAVWVMWAGMVDAQKRDLYRELRLRMVEQYIVSEGITNKRVLDSMRSVPRHEFLRASLRPMAYFDGAYPIGSKQTISPPYIVAYMTEIIDPQPNDKVLEIGTGSGYQAAVLSRLCQEVYTIEIVERLGRLAQRRLRRLGYKNVKLKMGDGFQGWPEHAPFDKIIVTCSPEDVPQPLIDQLKDGGKLLIPLGQRFQQVFHLFEKQAGKLQRTQLLPTLFVPMTGISESQRQVKPDPLNPQIVNGSFEIDANDDQQADHWHYQRQTTLGTDDAPDGSRYICFTSSEAGRTAQALQGMALDGSKIGALKISLSVKLEKTVAGLRRYEKPALVVHYYDSIRRPIGHSIFGPWTGIQAWQRVTKTLVVPAKTREIVVRIGLNGATGRLCVDNLQLTAGRR